MLLRDIRNQKKVYFPTSPEQCFCTTLQNRQTPKLATFTQCHMITIAVSKMGVAGLSYLVECGVNVNGMFVYGSKCYHIKLSKKMQFLCFSVLQGSAETLFR